MQPLWMLKSGRFAGWCADDGQLYGADGKHFGYIVDKIAYLNDGRAIGEIYGERYIGKREEVAHRTGSRHAECEGIAMAREVDRAGLPIAGWTDAEF